MLLTGSIGFFFNLKEDSSTKLTYDKIADIEGLIGNNAGPVDSVDSYNPLSNVTGWYGNSDIPEVKEGTTPYIVSPRNVTYTPTTYILDVTKEYVYTTSHTFDGSPISNSHWNTNKTATYPAYPVSSFTGNVYSDNTPIHGGYSNTEHQSRYDILDGVVSQSDSILYYVNNTFVPNGSRIIFGTVSDMITKCDISLVDGMRISLSTPILYKAGVTPTIDLSEKNENALISKNTSIKVSLNGLTNNASYIIYDSGDFYGYTSANEELWVSPSSATYFYTYSSKVTLTVETPSQSEPTYADSTIYTTIKNADMYDPESLSDTFDYVLGEYPLTTGTVNTGETFNYLWQDEVNYIIDWNYESQHTWQLINQSRDESLLVPSEIRDFFANGWRGLGVNSLSSTRAEDIPEGQYTYTFKNYVSKIGDQSIFDFVSTPILFNSLDTILYSKIPNPYIGMVVEISGNVQIGLGNASIHSDLATDPNASQYNWIGDYYMGYRMNTVIPATDGVWNIVYTSNGWEFSGYSRMTEQITDNIGVLGHGSVTMIPAGYLVLSMGGLNTISLKILPNESNLWNTNIEGVYSSGNALSNDQVFAGGQSGSVTEYTLKYQYNDVDKSYIVWRSLPSILASENIVSFGNVTKIVVTINGDSSSYSGLAYNFNDTYTKTVDSGVTTFRHNLSFNQFPIGQSLTIYHILGNNEEHITDHWECYLTIDTNKDTLLWSGQISDLMYITMGNTVIDYTKSESLTIHYTTYPWTDTPTADESVAYWSNTKGNPTIVNESVSLLLIPLGKTTVVDDETITEPVLTELDINIGDILSIRASPNNTQYTFSISLNNSSFTTYGTYVGLRMTFSIESKSMLVEGITEYENTKSYTISPLTMTYALTDATTSLGYIYAVANGSDWGAYVHSTKVYADPLGYLWGGFNINLDNYFHNEIPGLRMMIAGVVRYGDSLVINNVKMDIKDTQIYVPYYVEKLDEHNKPVLDENNNPVMETKYRVYSLSGMAIDYRDDNHTYLVFTKNMNKEEDLGSSVSYNVIGNGAWYFSSGAFNINKEDTKIYVWNPGWDLSFKQCALVMLITLIGFAIASTKIELLRMERLDWIVLSIAILITFLFLG